MITVPASEFQRKFGAYKEIAQREPVAVTSNGRNSVVVISAAEYESLKATIQKKRMAELKESSVALRNALQASGATTEEIEREITAALSNA